MGTEDQGAGPGKSVRLRPACVCELLMFDIWRADIGDVYGKKLALQSSLFLMALATTLMVRQRRMYHVMSS